MPTPNVNPSWSPNGNLIAFDSVRNGDNEVWVVDATDPTDIRNVTDNPGYDGQPSWSPDGSEVLFVSSRSGVDELWAAPVPPPAPEGLAATAGASTATQITDTPLIDESQPDWAAGEPRPDALIKRVADDAFVGNNIYDTTGASQARRVNARRGEVTRFRIWAQNDGAGNDSLELSGPGSSPGFSVRYFDGATEITGQVVAGSYSTGSLAPSAGAVIRMRVRVTNQAAVGAVERRRRSRRCRQGAGRRRRRRRGGRPRTVSTSAEVIGSRVAGAV